LTQRRLLILTIFRMIMSRSQSNALTGGSLMDVHTYCDHYSAAHNKRGGAELLRSASPSATSTPPSTVFCSDSGQRAPNPVDISHAYLIDTPRTEGFRLGRRCASRSVRSLLFRKLYNCSTTPQPLPVTKQEGHIHTNRSRQVPKTETIDFVGFPPRKKTKRSSRSLPVLG